MNEEWRDIPGYEGYYQVSSFGRVRSIDRTIQHPKGPKKLKGKILKHFFSQFGYHQVGLCGKTYMVYFLVASAFLGSCPEGQEIRHGPNGIDDNSVSNLSYGTRQQNALDQRRDHTDGGRPVIRSDGVIFQSISIAAEETNTYHSNIIKVCTGSRPSAGGFGWSYYIEEIETPKHPKTFRNRKSVTDGTKTFESSYAASKVTGIPQPSISACCNGKIKTASKRVWRYT